MLDLRGPDDYTPLEVGRYNESADYYAVAITLLEIVGMNPGYDEEVMSWRDHDKSVTVPVQEEMEWCREQPHRLPRLQILQSAKKLAGFHAKSRPKNVKYEDLPLSEPIQTPFSLDDIYTSRLESTSPCDPQTTLILSRDSLTVRPQQTKGETFVFGKPNPFTEFTFTVDSNLEMEKALFMEAPKKPRQEDYERANQSDLRKRNEKFKKQLRREKTC